MFEKLDATPGLVRREKKIYLGWSLARGNPRPWRWFEVPFVMVNALDFLSRRSPSGRAANILEYSGEIFCDSGGFQILNKRQSANVSRVLQKQEKLAAHLNASLDNALNSREHLANLRVYVEHMNSNPDFPVVPVVPFDASLSTIHKMHALYPDPPLVGVGNVVPALFPLVNRGIILRILRRIRTIGRIYNRSRLHVFGLGGVTTASLFFYFADSVDSSSWLHDARHGKVRLLGGGVARTTRPLSVDAFQGHQKDCGCPSCRLFGVEMLFRRGVQGLRMRALHNAWVTVQEMHCLNRALQDGTYDALVQERSKRSPWHRTLYSAVFRLLDDGHGL